MRGAAITHRFPPTGLLRYGLARLWMWLCGWRVEGEPPADAPRVVLIAYPHTSNWDFVHMIAAAWLYRFQLSWLGKDSLFKGPLGWLFRLMGGIPVNRSAPHGLVGEVADRLRAAEGLVIAVPPSGTRKRANHWKGGYYWIAHEAGVPIVPTFLDYGGRRLGMFDAFRPSGDHQADFDRLRALYQGMTGKYPQNQTPLLTKEEYMAETAKQAVQVG